MFILSIWSCSDKVDTIPLSTTNQVAMLRIDYLTHAFEAGVEYDFPTNPDFAIVSNYKAPGDFGSIQLYYEALDELLFDGTIVWAGTGAIVYPEQWNAEADFDRVETPTAIPEIAQFQLVEYDEFAIYPDTVPYADIWKAIEKLELTESYRASNPEAKIHLFLYTPSVGAGIPEEWDWLLFLKN